MPHRGRRRKKNRTHVDPETVADGSGALASSETKIPKTLVMRRRNKNSTSSNTTTAPELSELVMDLRKVLMPYTAMNFQDTSVQAKMTLTQLCTSLALPMGITHILQLSQNEQRCSLRIARIPEGPTLTFRIQRLSLIRHVQSLQRRPISLTGAITTVPPITVTNNFGDHTASPHIKLLRITFQNLFPQINVSTVKLKDCKRVVLFNLLSSTDETNNNEDGARDDGTSSSSQQQSTSSSPPVIVEMRHYAIQATPVGIDRKVRRIIQTKLPNLHHVQDIADYISGQTTSTTAAADGGAMSDSEPEDDPSHTVQLPDKYTGRGCHAHQKSALKLVELGPRLRLQLIKVEKGLDSNSNSNQQCLYHAYIQKTPQEVLEMQQKQHAELAAKEQRKAIQAANVERKRLELQEKRTAKRQKLEQRQQQQQSADSIMTTTAATDGGKNNKNSAYHIEGVSSSDDDDDDGDDSEDDNTNNNDNGVDDEDDDEDE